MFFVNETRNGDTPNTEFPDDTVVPQVAAEPRYGRQPGGIRGVSVWETSGGRTGRCGR